VVRVAVLATAVYVGRARGRRAAGPRVAT
jgi:hypothetical protein